MHLARSAPALALALLAACSGGGPRPNVLLVSIDSLRRDRLGAYGQPPHMLRDEPTTPALDRLAAQGVLFEDAVSTTSWTLPAHMALLTGLPDAAHGVTDNHHRLHPGVQTLAELFAAHGWATGGFYSGPNLHPAFGFGRGFEVYADCSGVSVPADAFAPDAQGAFRDAHLASHRAVTSPQILASASAWIRGVLAAGERPFFAFAHFWDPHYDYLAPREIAERFDPDYRGALTGVHHTESKMAWTERDRLHLWALYDAETRYTDDHVGRLWDELERLGVADDTVLVVVADHGEELYEHGRWGHQRTLYDEVVRIPLLVRWPGHVPAGARPRGQARIQDVLPTLAELCDLPLSQPTGGTSLSALWRDPAAPGPHQLLHLELPEREIHMSALRSARWKVVVDRRNGHGQLFDLARDPGELQPRFFEHFESETSAPARELRAALAELETLRARLSGTAEAVELPPELARDLAGTGYLGRDE